MTIVIDERFNEDTVVIGLTNSSGGLEYTVYHRGDGGVTDIPKGLSVAEALALGADLDSYVSYEVEED